MNLLHKTIIPCNELLFCTVRRIVSSDVVEAIMIYRHRVDFTTLKYVTEFGKVAILYPQSVPLEVSLIWGAVHDQYFFSITEDFDFIVSDLTNFPHFQQIFAIKLENIQLTHETKAITHNLHYICIATDSGNEVIIANIKNPKEPLFSAFTFNSKNIVSIIPATEKNSFAILVETQKESKLIYYLDCKTNNIYNTVRVDSSSFKLIYSLDPDNRQEFCVQKRKIIGIGTPITLTTKFDILLASNVVGNTISAVFDDKDNTYYVYSLTNKIEHFYRGGVEFTKLFTLPNSLLVLFSDGYYIILRIPATAKSRSIISQFSELQMIEVLQYKNTEVKSLALIDRKLYALTEFGMTSVTNQDPGDLGGEVMDFKSDGRMFSLGKKLQFYSTEKGTYSIENNMNKKAFKFIQDQKTLNMFLYNDSLIQVFSNGIFSNGKRILKECKKIYYSATNRNFLGFVTSKNEISLYKDNFSHYGSFQFDESEITSISMDDDYIAIALFDSQYSMQGKLCLFDYDLESIGQTIEIPSPIENLIFLHEGSELFAFALNGTIMKIEINKNKGFTQLISYIFSGKRSENAIKINDQTFAFISNTIIILYINDHIVSTGINQAVSIGFDSEYLSIIRKAERQKESPKPKSKSKSKKKKSKNDYDDEEEQEKQKEVIEDDSILYDYVLVSEVDLFEFDDSHITIFPEEEQHPAIQYMSFDAVDFLLRDNSLSAIKNQEVIKVYSIHGDPMKFTCSEVDTGIFHFIVEYENQHHITALKYNDDGPEFRMIFDQEFEDIIDSILLYREKVLVSTNGDLRIARIQNKSFNFSRAIVPSFGDDHPITYMIVYRDYIWVSYLNLKLSVYKYESQCDRFSIVSEIYSPFNVSSMHNIDDITMAVGEKNGTISFYQIPINSSIGVFTQPFGSDVIEIPELQCVFSCCAKDEISSFVTIPHCIIYSTTVGAIGAFIHGMTNEMLLHLHRVQQKIRRLAHEILGFSQKSRNAICSSSHIVDYDLINFYQKFIDPEDKGKLFDFYDISMITNIMQFLTF